MSNKQQTITVNLGDRSYDIVIGHDKFSIAIAEGNSPETVTGKKFSLTLDQLSRVIEAYGGLDVEYARKQMLAFFAKFTGEPVGDLSWKEMDKKFCISARDPKDRESAVIYHQLVEKGYNDEQD